MKKVNILDCAVIGFALFGMFFGAGNLIFPPFLGLESQGDWLLGFAGFIMMGSVLPVTAILSIGRNGDDARCLTNHLGVKLSQVILMVTIFCIGPLIAVPRTAATAFEFSIEPLLGENMEWVSWAFTAVFFLCAIALSIKQSQIITIIGAVLAPTMFVCLVFLIIKGALLPGEVPAILADKQYIIREGINAGYQTMDILAGVIFAASIISGTTARGYTDKNQRFKATAVASLITLSALAIVYGGLCFLGSRVTDLYGTDISRTELLGVIVTRILGSKGNIFLSILVLTACFTAAIGILSSCAAYMSNLTNGRISYKKVLLLFAGIGFLLSNLGVEAIMAVSVPILGVICPVLLTIIILGFFTKHIGSDTVYKAGCITAFTFSLLSEISTQFNMGLFVDKLPFADYSFGWAIPTIIVILLFSVKYKKILPENTLGKPVPTNN